MAVGRILGRCALAAALLALAGVSATAAAAAPRTQSSALSSLESGVLVDINTFRTQHHLAKLRLSRPLTAAARAHTQQMAQDGYFAHESADGSAFWKRVESFYITSPWRAWSVGENLLWSSPAIGPREALVRWLASPEHKHNLLNPAWREIGIAAVHAPHAPGVFHGLDVTIFTTDFGVRR
jgi:uncharacterized protein YkwD